MAGTNRLLNACKRSDAELLNSLLIESLFDIRRKDYNGETALHYCAKNEDPTCAELLLRNNPEISKLQDHSGYTALHVGIMRGNHTFVQKHLEISSLPIDILDRKKRSPLYYAIVSGDVKMFDLILSKKPSLEKRDKKGATALHHACRICGTPDYEDAGIEMIDRLIRNGAKINAVDKENRTPLVWAASIGSVRACKRLLESNADLGIRNTSNLLAIHCAASLGNSEVVRYLIEKYPSQIEANDLDGCSPIFYAVTMNQVETAKVLIDYGANVHRVDKRGRTLVHCAAIKDSVELIDKLVECNVQMWTKEEEGQTPLHLACRHASPDFVESLLNTEFSQEDIDQRNDKGQTALHIACMKGNPHIIQPLLEGDANVNILLKRERGHPATALDLTINEECRRLLKGHQGAKSAFQLLKKKRASAKRKMTARGSRLSSRISSQSSLQMKRESGQSTPVEEQFGSMNAENKLNEEEESGEANNEISLGKGPAELNSNSDAEDKENRETAIGDSGILLNETVIKEEEGENDEKRSDDDESLGIIDDDGTGSLESFGSALDEFGSDYSWTELEFQHELDKKVFGDGESEEDDDTNDEPEEEEAESDHQVIENASVEETVDEDKVLENGTDDTVAEETKQDPEPSHASPPVKKKTRRRKSPDQWYRNSRALKTRRRKSPKLVKRKASPTRVSKIRDSVRHFNYVREEVAFINDSRRYRMLQLQSRSNLPSAPFRRVTVDQFYKNHPNSTSQERLNIRKENYENYLQRIKSGKGRASPSTSTQSCPNSFNKKPDTSFRQGVQVRIYRPLSGGLHAQRTQSPLLRPNVDLSYAGVSNRVNSAFGYRS